MGEPLKKSLLVTDLDNTLWDWFQAWHTSFSAMLERLAALSGIPQRELEAQIRRVHQLRGTSEYSNLLREVPGLVDAAAPNDPFVVFDPALHILHSRRRSATRLYPGVLESLLELKRRGVRIVAYTESIAYWTEWRVRHTGLDGVIDVLYSAPDHDLPHGISFEDLRTLPASEYGLRETQHEHVERGLIKPNVKVLLEILADQNCSPEEAVYIGDSLMKDVAMAQGANVLDVHAAYGLVQSLPEYELLRRVSHWTDEDVNRERQLMSSADEIVASVVCQVGFGEVVPLFGK